MRIGSVTDGEVLETAPAQPTVDVESRAAPTDNACDLLALAKTYALDGRLQEARDCLEQYARGFAAAVVGSFNVVNDFTETAFRLRAFSALSIFAREAYGAPIDVSIASNLFGCVGLTRWIVSTHRPMQFVFDEQIYDHPYLNVLLKHWVHGLPMYCHFSKLNSSYSGSVDISLEDMGVLPGICFSDYRDEYTLLPDPIFMGTGGYSSIKNEYYSTNIAWSDRQATAIWRGSTTGWFDVAGKHVTAWQQLPRIQLCMLAQQHGHEDDLLDAGITSASQIAIEAGADIAALGIQRPFMDWREFQKYKYQIDIDGNSCTWPGLFTKLCSGSVVFKVESPIGFRQWYYDRLIPWINYVPVAADMSDLLEKIGWLRQRDDLAQLIADNGVQLTKVMTPANETYLSERAILQAFRNSGNR